MSQSDATSTGPAPGGGGGTAAQPTVYHYYESPYTRRLRPSGGPIEGGSRTKLLGVGFRRYTEAPRCVFGHRLAYDAYFDSYFPLPQQVL